VDVVPALVADLDVPETLVFTFRGGKVAEVREYRTTEEALGAVGLSDG
jgi:hypothetical protein